jgi:hypothetical protein
MACGTPITVVYTATFHASPNNAGGTTHFTYNTDNGRASTPGSLTFAPGDTTKTFVFNWQGTLLADHTFPEAGGVNVTSPNVINSPLLGPSGACTEAAAFQVASITMTARPATISNLHCAIPVTIFYSATFNVPANGPGGTIQFAYGVNDGKNVATTPASITLAPGQTSATYRFQWNGAFVAGQQYSAGVATTSPNVVNVSLQQPTGTCIQ